MLQSQKQSLRLRRALLANLALMLCIPLCVSSAYSGFVSVSPFNLLLYLVGVWLVHLSLVALIYFNWNLRFKDASLTMFQMIWSILGLSGLMYMMSDIRTLILMGYMLVMAFGSFRLSFQGFQGIMAITVSCYLTVLYLIQNYTPEQINIVEELFIFLGFIMVLSGFVFMGAETSHLRKVLSERHRELKGAISRIEELAITDELTGLFNRRNLLKILTQQRALANRSRYGFVVCYLDLDYFKKVNDQYGHPFGDRVLKAFSTLITDSLREVDVGARIGGEEFVLVLADTQLAAAKKVCERMASNWQKQRFPEAPGMHFTFSGGITEFKSPESIEQALERADSLLYEAKNSGRNCLMTDHPDLQVPLDLNLELEMDYSDIDAAIEKKSLGL